MYQSVCHVQHIHLLRRTPVSPGNNCNQITLMASRFLFLRLLIGSSLTDCVPVDLRNCVVRTFASGIDIRYPLAPCVSNSFIFSFFFFNQISLHVSRSLSPSYLNFIWNFCYTLASSSSSEYLDRDPPRCLLLSDVSAIFLLWRAQERSLLGHPMFFSSCRLSPRSYLSDYLDWRLSSFSSIFFPH